MSQKYAFVAAHASSYPVSVLCRVLGLARSGYYAWKRRPASVHAQLDTRLTTLIQTIFRDSRSTYGSPRVHATLHAQGHRCSRKRVARLMRAAALVARTRQRRVRTTDSRHDQPLAPNVLARNFQTSAPNQVWLADITYLPTREGWRYLAGVLDLFARRVVGWSMAPTLERGSCSARCSTPSTAATRPASLCITVIAVASTPVVSIKRCLRPRRCGAV